MREGVRAWLIKIAGSDNFEALTTADLVLLVSAISVAAMLANDETLDLDGAEIKGWLVEITSAAAIELNTRIPARKPPEAPFVRVTMTTATNVAGKG